MVLNKDGFKDVFFSREVVVNTAEGEACVLGYLAHRSAVITLGGKKLEGCLDDG
jgi:hypothetical protein